MLNKKIHIITAHTLVWCMLFTAGCAGSFHAKSTRFLYGYTMVAPIASEEMLYKDEYIIIQFKIDESAIRFQMQNISAAPISIAWEEVSIALNKRTYAVKNSATLYSGLPVLPHAVVIPPLGYVRDVVIPRENVYLENSVWKEKEFFPADDKGSQQRRNMILKFIGSQISLHLPVMISDVKKDYSYTFKVKKITPLPSNTLPPEKERPPVPKSVQTGAAVSQSIVPIIITVGVLGVAVFLLSQKKTPAGDL